MSGYYLRHCIAYSLHLIAYCMMLVSVEQSLLAYSPLLRFRSRTYTLSLRQMWVRFPLLLLAIKELTVIYIDYLI